MNNDDARALKAHDEWRAWGGQFGWRLVGSTYEREATFLLSDGSYLEISNLARKAINARLDEAVHHINMLLEYDFDPSGGPSVGARGDAHAFLASKEKGDA